MRVVDRDDLLSALSAEGLEPEVLDGEELIGLELECVDADGCADLIHAIEGWLTENGLPLVPEQVGGRIVLRPPGG